MPIDFSSLQAEPAQTGHMDFSALGALPAVGDVSNEDETSTLGATARGAVGMIPLGTQALTGAAALAENKPYAQERAEIEKEIEADIANHPMARTIGQAAGVVAPAILTGGASAPESLAGAAGEGAIMGAGFGTGNAIDTLTSGGSGARAAGDIVLGAGLGALGGVAGQKVAGALNKAVPGIESYAARKAIQGVGMGSDELGTMTQQELIDTGKMLMDKGIVKQGASTQEMFDTAKNELENVGERIGQVGNKARELGLSTDIKPILERLDEKYNAADALQNPDERRAAIFYKRGMADVLTMARQNMPEALADVQGAPVPNDITFDQLQRLKRSYGNSAFENGAVKNPAAADIYGALSDAQKTIVNKARTNPELPQELQDAMASYSKLHPVVSGLQDVLGRERAGNLPAKGFGMMGKMVGQLPGQSNPIVNALTALGLLGAGHPMWAVGAATATLQNPRAMSSAANALAGAIPEVAGKLPEVAGQVTGAQAPHMQAHHTFGQTALHHAVGHAPLMAHEAMKGGVDVDHPALAAWKPMFQKNAANAKNPGEAQKANAVTDFVLSQRDPAYAAAKQKASDEPRDQQTQGGGMANGGVVEGKKETPITQAPALPVMEKVSVPGPKKQREPFNTELGDKLKAFMAARKEKNDAQSR